MRAQLEGASDENTKGVIICPVIKEGGGGEVGGEGGCKIKSEISQCMIIIQISLSCRLHSMLGQLSVTT